MEIELKCPYCDNHQYIDGDSLRWQEDDEKDVTCRNCEKVYVARGYISVNYAAEEKETP